MVEQRVVSAQEALDFATSNGLMYIETSAKDASNVTEVYSSHEYNTIY